jgi:Domain of unknown function (DUF4180)
VTLEEIGGRAVLVADEAGPLIGARQDAVDLVGEAMGMGARVVALPVSRLDPAFFTLSTGIAGEFIQTLINYRLIVAIVGDISAHTAAGAALRDFVRESNRGRSVFFLPDVKALAEKLASLA